MDDQNKSMNERWAPPTDRGERGYATDPGFASGAEYTTRPDYGTTSPVDESAERRTTEIRSEIDRTRADMGETIDAIQDRLNPRNVASRAAESVREATVGRVKQFAGSVSDHMPHRSHAWDGTRGDGLLDRVRDNPIPVAIAAASIAWIAFGGRRRQNADRGRAIYGSTRGGEAFIRETRIDLDESPASQGRGPRGSWNDSGDSAVDRAQRTASQVGDRAQRAASEAGARVRHAADDVRRRSRRMASDSPLATGAIAAAIGLAIGLALPETERENEVMGEVRDSVVDRGREAVKTAAERVQNAAGEVQRVATDAIKGVASDDTGAAGSTGNTGKS